MTSLVNADDCVPRLSTGSFAALLQELAAFDWRQEAARQRQLSGGGGGEEGASASSSSSPAVAQHLAQLLHWVLDKAGGGGGGAAEEGQSGGGSGSAPDDTRDVGDGGDGDDVSGDGGILSPPLHYSPYNAHVPGRVVLIYPSAAAAADVEGRTAGEDGEDGITGGSSGLALLPCTHPAVQRLRVSSAMLGDHFVDSPKVVAALGG